MMTLSYPVQVRLTEEKQKLFEELAAFNGKPLATFLRERLEDNYDIQRDVYELHCAFHELRKAIEITQKQDRENLKQESNAVQLEALLLLRALASSETRSMVTGELKRNGLETWQPTS